MLIDWSEKGKWKTSQNELIDIKDMSLDHIVNCIKLMRGYLYLGLYTEAAKKYITSKCAEMKREFNKRNKLAFAFNIIDFESNEPFSPFCQVE